jgi:hypothetical protein
LETIGFTLTSSISAINLARVLAGDSLLFEFDDFIFRLVLESKHASSEQDAATLKRLSIERDLDIVGSKFKKLLLFKCNFFDFNFFLNRNKHKNTFIRIASLIKINTKIKK